MGKRLAGTLLAVVLLISFGAAYGEEYPVDVSGMKAAVLCSQDGQSIIEYNSAERLEVGGLGRLPLLLRRPLWIRMPPRPRHIWRPPRISPPPLSGAWIPRRSRMRPGKRWDPAPLPPRG